MERMIRQSNGWLVGVAVGFLILTGVLIDRSLYSSVPKVLPESLSGDAPDPSLVFQDEEPVGWVFGRVVGFQGADKPFLPNQSFPSPTMIPRQARAIH